MGPAGHGKPPQPTPLPLGVHAGPATAGTDTGRPPLLEDDPGPTARLSGPRLLRRAERPSGRSGERHPERGLPPAGMVPLVTSRTVARLPSVSGARADKGWRAAGRPANRSRRGRGTDRSYAARPGLPLHGEPAGRSTRRLHRAARLVLR